MNTEIPELILIMEQLNRIEEKIDGLTEGNPIHKEFLNIEETAELMQVSKQTVYKLTSQSEIPFYKVGKKLMFDRVEIIKYIRKHRNVTNEDIEKMANEYISRKRRK
jgi:excisionase family DNA binding protein